MNAKDLVRGRKYKFDNILFKKENPGCFGIEDIDSTFLFNSKIITLTDFCWSYTDGDNEVFSDVELDGDKKIYIYNSCFAFYIEGFKSFNLKIENSTGRRMWYSSNHIKFLKYLEKIDKFVQEEFDI